MPVARLQLLRTLAEAVPPRLGLPVDAVAALLHCGGREPGQPPAWADGRGTASARHGEQPPPSRGEYPWEHAARFCALLRQPVHLLGAPSTDAAPTEAGADAAEPRMDAALLARLHYEAAAAEAAAGVGQPMLPPPLVVRLDKGVVLEPRSLDVRMRVALTPERWEAPPPGVTLPGSREALAAFVMAPLAAVGWRSVAVH